MQLNKETEMNVIAWLEFELAFYNVIAQHANHYRTEALLPDFWDEGSNTLNLL